MTLEIRNENLKKIRSFLLTAVQQMQPTLTLHCPKLVQNIKIRISRDVRAYTWKIYYDRVYFRFRHLEFEPSGSAVTPNPTSFQNGVLGHKDHVSH